MKTGIMKAAISLTMCMVFMGLSTVCFAAENKKEYEVFNFEDGREVIVYGEDLTHEEKERVAEAITADGENSEIATHGIACIFGHSLKTTNATEIVHNAYSSSPKCKKTIYKVERCTRSSCDYTKKTVVKTARISTCHG